MADGGEMEPGFDGTSVPTEETDQIIAYKKKKKKAI